MVGLDVGTMNLVAARTGSKDKVAIKSIRNCFLELDSEIASTLDLSDITHTEIDESTYIVGHDAFAFGNMFNQPIKRPMQKGMISSENVDAADILTVMVSSIVGEPESENERCFYSIPAESLDYENNVLYHEAIFGRILNALGYQAVPFNEASAVVFAECADKQNTGIGISFGAGMTNVSVVYKGIEISKFSLARGGDWIDENASQSLGMVANRLTAIKEKPDFDLLNPAAGGKKNERRLREALGFYYTNLIHYTITHISKELEGLDTEFPSSIRVVVSGGTSMPSGFLELVKQTFDRFEFPFDIEEVRHAGDPLGAVAKGCLIKAMK